MKSVAICAALVSAGLAVEPVHAADMAPLFGQSADTDMEAPQPMTFGSGWYLRGDLTASDDTEPHLLGTLPENTSVKRGWGYGIGGGAGYQFNDYFRADLTGDYLSTQKTVEPSSSGWTAKSNLRRFDGLANAYIDLGTWAGLTPYIGAGVGFAGLRIDGSLEYSVPPAYSYFKYSGKTRYDLAWAAMAGFAYHLTPNLMLDLGYRYLDLGTYKVQTMRNTPFSVSTTDLTSHEIRAGLRYMIY